MRKSRFSDEQIVAILELELPRFRGQVSAWFSSGATLAPF